MAYKFGFLLFNNFEDLDFFGPWEMLGIWRDDLSGPVELVTVSEEKLVNSVKGLELTTSTNFSNCPPLDFLIIPGGQGAREAINNKKIVDFIAQQSIICKQILSICTATFLLHAAGLLKNKKVTTHWEFIPNLRELTEVEVINKRFVQDKNIWTSAGVSSGIDMILAFISNLAGEKTAGDIQLYSEYYPSKKIYQNHKNYLPKYI